MKVYVPLSNVRPDPVQYKPYAPSMNPENIWVEMNVPDEHVLSGQETKLADLPKGAIVVSAKGVAAMLQEWNREFAAQVRGH